MLAAFRYFAPLSKLERARAHYLAQNPVLPNVLKTLLITPLPGADCPLDQLPILALDFETTGLDPYLHHILSIGTVALNGAGIELSSAHHNYVNDPRVINAETAVINQLLPELLATGQPLDVLMEALLVNMAGQVMLAHGSMVERCFIDAYIASRFGLPPLPLLWLDTLHMEKRRYRHQRELSGDFRLSALRQQAGLPDYPAHDALLDAVATAELLLFYSAKLVTSRPVTLADLLKLQGNKTAFVGA
ncbi:hypothetical protein C9426_14655 [Serratia sp. S1B]|nr:hypothetical protein C9426_14655 [Serratia sp. S1B]